MSPNVEKINVVDFIECDRIAVCRPRTGVDTALTIAEDFLEKRIPYDFGFNTKDMNALYCFELGARCYPDADIKTFHVKKFFGLFSKDVYLADSFKQSGDFDLIFEYNPKRDVDICTV